MKSQNVQAGSASEKKVCVHIVEASGLRREYGPATTPVVALAEATCQIEPGQHIALVGPSGSGKSTLLHLLAGLDAPTAGAITWPALGALPPFRPGLIGVVFQAQSLLPPLTVVENVALPLLLNGKPPDLATEAARAALAMLDLDTLANKLPEELSGGQAQRVAVARVLAAEPILILADEPTGQLDRVSGRRVIDTLVAASISTGAALVINTHDLSIAERLSVRWSMRDGNLTTGAPPATDAPPTSSVPSTSSAPSTLSPSTSHALESGSKSC